MDKDKIIHELKTELEKTKKELYIVKKMLIMYGVNIESVSNKTEEVRPASPP